MLPFIFLETLLSLNSYLIILTHLLYIILFNTIHALHLYVENNSSFYHSLNTFNNLHFLFFFFVISTMHLDMSIQIPFPLMILQESIKRENLQPKIIIYKSSFSTNFQTSFQYYSLEVIF